jgi:tetratricopeptide (TPR) repeat protein
LAALALADALDAGRAQVALARARVLWASGAGPLAALAECVRAIRGILAGSLRDINTLHGSALILLAAAVAGIVLFSAFMVLRYQVALRHDVEEWLIERNKATWSKAGGWAFLLAPLILWVGAGWIAIYWIVVCFRYMRRGERLLAASLLCVAAFIVPGYRFAVGLYGLAADPTVRTTVAAANGGYDPDRIVKLLELVEAHPEDSTYRFLLAGLYKNGRYFEDAFREYKRVIEAEPSNYQATINLGNSLFRRRPYGEAISNYRKAIELRPDCVLATTTCTWPSRTRFKLKEAAESLAHANRSGSRADHALARFRQPRRRRREGDRRRRRRQLDLEGDGRRPPLERVARGRRRGRGSRLVASQPRHATSVIALLALVGLRHEPRDVRRANACEALRAMRATVLHALQVGTGRPSVLQPCAPPFRLGGRLGPETKSMKLYEVGATRDAKPAVAAHLLRILPGAHRTC